MPNDYSRRRSNRAWGGDDIDDTDYEVEKILDHDTIRGTRWYLVHWKGFDEVHESTWEERGSLTARARNVLRAYERKHPNDPIHLG